MRGRRPGPVHLLMERCGRLLPRGLRRAPPRCRGGPARSFVPLHPSGAGRRRRSDRWPVGPPVRSAPLGWTGTGGDRLPQRPRRGGGRGPGDPGAAPSRSPMVSPGHPGPHPRPGRPVRGGSPSRRHPLPGEGRQPAGRRRRGREGVGRDGPQPRTACLCARRHGSGGGRTTRGRAGWFLGRRPDHPSRTPRFGRGPQNRGSRAVDKARARDVGSRPRRASQRLPRLATDDAGERHLRPRGCRHHRHLPRRQGPGVGCRPHRGL